jgi:amyloid beta precursor protein binding protein 1
MRALKRFVENEGQAREVDGSIATLPLSGNLPDMHADTKSYVELQNIYREQAARDRAAVAAHLQVMTRKRARARARASERERERERKREREREARLTTSFYTQQHKSLCLLCG